MNTMDSESTIILCGGPINYSNQPIGTNQSNAMIPVNGKPVIGWILSDLLDKGIRKATVVLREHDYRLQNFLKQAFTGRLDLSIAPLRRDGTIVNSLQAGLRCSPSDGLVRIILGDTLIRDSYAGENDFVYVGPVEDSRRWCLALTNGNDKIIEYLEKQDLSSDPKMALAGYYHLLRGGHLRECVEQSMDIGEPELSHVLRRYGSTYPIVARHVHEWYDFGHIDHLVRARQRLLQPRFFNSLEINPVLNTITKVSDNVEKLRDEVNWLLNIPDELKVLTPRIVGHDEMNGQLRVVQEYYGYPTLAELYVYADLHPDTWLSILRRVLRIHSEFRRHAGTLNPRDIAVMYLQKTQRRLGELQEQDPSWESLLSRESLIFNGRSLRNVGALLKPLRRRVRSLAESAQICVMHGDFCFSNILFDVNNQIIRLIDPRGSFNRKGIYGDSRYDIAKLRHSVRGLYDYILADMFDIREEDGEFFGEVYANGTPRVVGEAFDEMITDSGYHLDDIRLIEGLLFTSMLPLHDGHPRRQRMMFFTGLLLLNDIL